MIEDKVLAVLQLRKACGIPWDAGGVESLLVGPVKIAM